MNIFVTISSLNYSGKQCRSPWPHRWASVELCLPSAYIHSPSCRTISSLPLLGWSLTRACDKPFLFNWFLKPTTFNLFDYLTSTEKLLKVYKWQITANSLIPETEQPCSKVLHTKSWDKLVHCFYGSTWTDPWKDLMLWFRFHFRQCYERVLCCKPFH